MDHYRSQEALYPGCGIHITPSFFIPHVVYIDKDPSVKDFFAEHESIITFINQNKRYKRSTYIRFIQADYSNNASIVTDKFDLVIALFANGVVRRFVQNLKSEGILLTHHFHNEVQDALNTPSLQYKSIIQIRGKKYQFMVSHQLPLQKTGREFIKRKSTGFEYKEEETYFIFQKR